MSSPASSLPDRWVQNIWTELRANYGARWDRMYPVPPVPPGTDPAQHAIEHIASVQRIWAKKLGRFQGNPNAIRFALDNLPADPPDLPKFESMCNRRPDKPAPQLEAPKADPVRVQRVIAGIDRSKPQRDPLQPLRELAESDARDGTYKGRKVTLAQRQTYRKALRMDRQEPSLDARAHLEGAQ